MKIVLGTHTLTGYPRSLDGPPPTAEARRNLFGWLRRHGFDGIEIGSWWLDVCRVPVEDVASVRDELADYGLELAGFNLLRKNVAHPAVADENARGIRHAVTTAKRVGSRFVSISFSLAGATVGVPEDRVRGTRESPGSSRDASDADYERTAALLREVARDAAEADVAIAVELHHCSLADTSASLIRLLEVAGEPNLTANPDLGNPQWGYSVPEEQWHAAIARLAPRIGRVWHVKNIQRIYVPDIDRSFFVQAPLGEGEIDYRWAMANVLASGFDGYISIEGAGPGDVLTVAARGKTYLDDLIADVRAGVGLGVQ